MSSVRVKGTGASTSVLKKMIESIKEITGQNHSDDEIHAMLKECSMDPNEALQKLLLLDKFHEVKSKRDRRKENQMKELPETKWKPGTLAQANRVGRGNYSSGYKSNDSGGGKELSPAKESGTDYLSEKSARSSSFSSAVQEKKRNASSYITRGTERVNNPNASVSAGMSKYVGLPPVSAPSDPIKSDRPQDIEQQRVVNLSNRAPVVQMIVDSSIESRLACAGIATPEVGISVVEQKVPNELQAVGNNHQLDTLPTTSSAISSSAIGPSSNYNNQSHVIESQKVGSGKEWKPKSAVDSNDRGATSASPCEVPLSVGSHPELLTTPVAPSSKEAALDLQQKLGKLSVYESHVIIPDHLHVPEVEKLGFCFGSFDASFEFDMNKHGAPGSVKRLPTLESSEAMPMDEPVTVTQISYENETASVDDVEAEYPDTEAEYPEPLESPTQDPENLQSDVVKVSSSSTIDNMSMNIAPNYSSGPVPPVMSNPLAPSKISDSQAHDAPYLPAFVMPQSFDPSSYYAPFYRSGMDINGRISPFHIGGTSLKYNDSAALVSAQLSQTPQEGGGVPLPLILSTASPTPLMSQAAGVMQSPAQQPFPVFRQPSGVPLPHYNYIAYGPYFSPFYVSQPAFHQQPPQPSSLYPTAKYSLSQYNKQGSNAGASNHIVVPGSYGPYGLSTANHYPSSAITSASDEDHVAPQAKENNIYASGLQNDLSSVWFAAPNRGIAAVQASSLYNLPQGQLAFTPIQQGHSTFTRFAHPAHALTPATLLHPLLQQPQTITNPADIGRQNAQINWPGNY